MITRSIDSKILALIPARGGSKNPPNKNLLPFNGKPLIVHSIEHAMCARSVMRVVVSTNSERIAEVSVQAGAEVPFQRPGEYATDIATDLEVFQHALQWLEEHEGYRPELVVHLRPTSPIRPSGLIDRGIERILAHPEADSLRTVIKAPHTPYKMWYLNGDFLEPLLTHPHYHEPFNMPRQLLPQVYWQNAYLDIVRWSTVMEKGSMTGRCILALLMQPEEDVDIDGRADFDRAEKKAAIGQSSVNELHMT